MVCVIVMLFCGGAVMVGRAVVIVAIVGGVVTSLSAVCFVSVSVVVVGVVVVVVRAVVGVAVGRGRCWSSLSSEDCAVGASLSSADGAVGAGGSCKAPRGLAWGVLYPVGGLHQSCSPTASKVP